MAEQYYWVAEATDTSKLFEDEATFGQVMDLFHQGKLHYLYLMQEGKAKLVVKLGGKRKPIFFRRRMNHISPKGSFTWTITCIGWEENHFGTDIKTLLYIYPNGNIELNNDEPTMATAYHDELIRQLQESNP